MRRDVAALALSASALVGIAMSEGFRSRAYDDGVGIQTIGFGTTQGVKAGDAITVERALVRLADDVSRHEQELRRCIHVPLYQREWDALVSWAYNVGVRCNSTLIRKLNAGDHRGACDELLRWTRAGGKELPGLVKRRKQEHALCIGLSAQP